MTLIDFWNYHDPLNTYPTDKARVHDYIQFSYSPKFSHLQNEPIKILEIGVLQLHSMRLWRDYFVNAEIFGMDNNNEEGLSDSQMEKFSDYNSQIKYSDDLVLGTRIYLCNAYSQPALDLFANDYFDFIIDDGCHDLWANLYTAEHWLQKVKPGGYLIIEDIQDFSTNHLTLEKLNDEMCLEKYVLDRRDYPNATNRVPGSYRWDNVLIEAKRK